MSVSFLCMRITVVDKGVTKRSLSQEWQFKIQQNSFNPTPHNFKILIMWHFTKTGQRLEVLLFTTQKLHRWNRLITGTCSERRPRVYVQQPFWRLLTPCLLLQLLQLRRLQKTQKMTLNQQMKKISKWNPPLISCTAQLGVVEA